MIKTISIRSYKEARPKRYRYETVEDICGDILTCIQDDIIHSDTSKYEVLTNKVRRLYFDIENIPSDNVNLINDIENDINTFIKNKDANSGKQMNEDMKFVQTINQGSKTHNGLSYHLICYNYCMNVMNLKGLVTEFLNTVGEKYKAYIDCAVYSSLRLFKLPYYIGLQKDVGIDETDINNVHKFTTKTLESENFNVRHCIIQYTNDVKELSIDFVDNKKWVANHMSFNGGGNNNINKHTKEICKLIFKNIHGNFEDEFKLFELQYLYERKHVLNEASRSVVENIYKLNESGSITKENVTTYNALLMNIKNKFANELKDL